MDKKRKYMIGGAIVLVLLLLCIGITMCHKEPTIEEKSKSEKTQVETVQKEDKEEEKTADDNTEDLTDTSQTTGENTSVSTEKKKTDSETSDYQDFVSDSGDGKDDDENVGDSDNKENQENTGDSLILDKNKDDTSKKWSPLR